LELNLLEIDPTVSSPVAKMSQAVVERARVMAYPFRTVLGAIQRFLKNHRKRIESISCGLMVASAAVMPSLFPESLGLRGFYKAYFFFPPLLFCLVLTIGSMMAVWALASIPFIWLNRVELLL